MNSTIKNKMVLALAIAAATAQAQSNVSTINSTSATSGKTQESVLAIGVTPMSDYVMDAEVNQYKNFVDMAGASMSCSRLSAAEAPTFTFYRYPVSHISGKAVKVATVAITGATVNGATTTFDYSVTYSNQEGADAAAYPATAGTFASDGEAVNFGDFQVCDQFFASTASNEHPGSYEYRVDYSEGGSVVLSSAFASVKVFKTTTQVIDQYYTFEYVEADSVCSAHAAEAASRTKAPNFQFETENDSQIDCYRTYKVAADGSCTEVARAQRTPNGTYMVMQDGAKNATCAAGDNAIVWTNDGEYGTYKLASVINTYRAGANGEYNTYGAPANQVTHLGLQATECYLEMSDDTFVTNDGAEGRYYKASLNIAAMGASLDGEILRYRVWRITPDGTAMEVNAAHQQRLNQDSHPADMYVYAGGPVLNSNCKSDFMTSGEAFLPSRIDENTISFTDVFGARAFDATLESLPVTYVVRMYAMPCSATEPLLFAESLFGDDCYIPAEKYYIGETTTQVTFTSNVPTSVADIDSAEKIKLSVRYVNILGSVSEKPFEGLNVVLTTYADGTTTKTKKMF